MTDSADSKTAIEATLDGPYVVKDPPTLKNSRGQEIETKPVTALCRCGRSGNRPFCDGTHRKVGFSGARLTDGSLDKKEVYRGRRITIHDNRGICAHAARCTEGLPAVFKYGQEPWIDPDAASAEEIKSQIHQCPSGALSYTVEGVEHDDFHNEPGIAIVKDGPYRVSGGIELKDPVTGQRPASLDHYTLCRCGGSKNKPFCDGTHWEGFKDDKN